MTIETKEVKAFIESLNVSHFGVTLTKDNVTIAGLAYLIDMGLKQSLSDVDSVNRAKIIGVNKNGGAVDGAWKETKRTDEAKRLSVEYDGSSDSRGKLADAWIADATAAKFGRILSGDLTVSESGTRGDAVLTEMRSIVGEALVTKIRKTNDSLPKASRVEIPTGKDLRKLVDEKLADETFAAKVRELAEQRLGMVSGIEL
jgi:hypothetical protein